MDAARPPALAPLDALVGAWSMEATFPGSGPAAVTGRTTFAWALGGRFLLQRSEVPHPDAPDSLAVIGLDHEGRSLLQHYFDERGVARVYGMTFAGGVWTLVRETPDFSPLDFAQRFTGTLAADGDSIDGRWEAAVDGSDWALDFELRYTRLPEFPGAGAGG